MNRPEGNLSIETLIEANVNWKVVYTYCNWGDNILFLLPNFQVDEDEDAINQSVIDSANDICEIDTLIRQFIGEHPTFPFIICGTSISHCVSKMESRLDAYCGDFNKFTNDSEVFDRFRRTIHYVMNGDEPLAYHAAHLGWEATYTMMTEGNYQI